MQKEIFTLLLFPVMLPAFSQTSGAAIDFKTKEGKVYNSLITAVDGEECILHFTQPGYNIRVANEKILAMQDAKKKTCFSISRDVETSLKDEAAARLHQLFKTCSFTQGKGNQYRFCKVSNCSLFVFYTSTGYDNASIDYHMVRMDLSANLAKSLFSRQPVAEKTKSRDGSPIVEIAKHTYNNSYNEEEFTDVANWNNQPEYRNALKLYFLDVQSPAFQNATDSLRKTFDFLQQACR